MEGERWEMTRKARNQSQEREISEGVMQHPKTHYYFQQFLILTAYNETLIT